MVATVPAPPPAVVRIESVSPARMLAVRPETVVMRGSERMRAVPFWMSGFNVKPIESGVREKG